MRQDSSLEGGDSKTAGAGTVDMEKDGESELKKQ